MRLYIDHPQRTFFWSFFDQSRRGFRLVVPFDYISPIHRSTITASSADSGISLATVHLTGAPLFFLRAEPSTATPSPPWKDCYDWTPNQQASSVFTHVFEGPTIPLEFLINTLNSDRLVEGVQQPAPQQSVPAQDTRVWPSDLSYGLPNPYTYNPDAVRHGSNMVFSSTEVLGNRSRPLNQASGLGEGSTCMPQVYLYHPRPYRGQSSTYFDQLQQDALQQGTQGSYQSAATSTSQPVANYPTISTSSSQSGPYQAPFGNNSTF